MKFKRLLVVTPAFPNRSDDHVEGIFIKEQVKYLKDYFLDVHVISPKTIWNKSVFNKNRGDYTWDNVHVYYPLIVNLPSPYVPTILKNMWIRREAGEISKFIASKNIEFDLIHAHYTWFSGAVALELKRKFKTPVVITEHTSGALSKALKRRDPSFIDTWTRCDTLINVNKKATSDLKEFNEKSIYIPNGFDSGTVHPLNKQECRAKLRIPQDTNLIISIGSLTEVKGHRFLIKAMKTVHDKRADILCIIGGSGPLKNSLQMVIDDLKLRDQVRLIGEISRKDISTLINASDVFVLPSLKESFGIVQMEAFACGKPVVATRNGGSEEIIISEEYGYLVEPGNDVLLAEKILKALDYEWDEDLIRDYSKAFSWDQISKKIVSSYENLDLTTCSH